MSVKYFVPEQFKIPPNLKATYFIFEILSPEWLKLDYQAIMSSIDHLHKTPTPPVCGKDWPKPNLTIEENLKDLKWHKDMFIKRKVFAWTVLKPNKKRVIGCVYFFPSKNMAFNVDVYFWVTKYDYDRGLDQKLYQTITNWLTKWPFKKYRFPGRNKDGKF